MAADASFTSPVEAYPLVIDVLVTLRRVVARGLAKGRPDAAIDDFLNDAARQRLEAVRDGEAVLARSNGACDQLVDLTTFEELAELVEDSDGLASRLASLAHNGGSLADELRDLERIRDRVARATPVTATDLSTLIEFQLRLRQLLKGIKPARGIVVGRSGSPAPSRQEATRSDAACATASPLNGSSCATPVRSTIASQSAPSGPASQNIEVEGLHANRPVGETFGVEEALAGDDADAVLRALHSEVISVADAVYARQEWHPAVWETVQRAGWWAEYGEQLELEPIEIFYTFVDEFFGRRRAGASDAELDELRQEAGLPNLLLTMREVFLRLV